MCYVDMSVGRGDQKYVSLSPGDIFLDQSRDLTQFSIVDFSLENATSPKSGLQMRIRLRRKIMSEMMTTYFPTILLLMITFATTFFKPFFFEAALSVNLTTMLVMTTIFMSKMEGLPPTSSTKMIDYWLILCQLVPFSQVVLLTAMEYLREEEQTGNQVKERENIQSTTGDEGVDAKSIGVRTTLSKNSPKSSIVSVLSAIGRFFTKFQTMSDRLPEIKY